MKTRLIKIIRAIIMAYVKHPDEVYDIIREVREVLVLVKEEYESSEVVKTERIKMKLSELREIEKQQKQNS